MKREHYFARQRGLVRKNWQARAEIKRTIWLQNWPDLFSLTASKEQAQRDRGGMNEFSDRDNQDAA